MLGHDFTDYLVRGGKKSLAPCLLISRRMPSDSELKLINLFFNQEIVTINVIIYLTTLFNYTGAVIIDKSLLL